MSYDHHYLSSLFEPSSIAVIGASERPGSVGATLISNIIDAGYNGKLYCVNPCHSSILGMPAYASVDEISQQLDLAVICTRGDHVPAIVEACGRAGTRNAIIISSDFAESGQRGANQLRTIRESAQRHHLRLLGPNCLGVMRPGSKLNATFAHAPGKPGSIGLISHSGALSAALLDWALPNKIGFSNVVSLGNELDIDFGEVLDYMVSDPRTESIFMYIEGIKNARRFMSALRAAARFKPVLLIKVGRHPAGKQAAISHSGALIGSDDVFDAALRRAGVVRLANVGQMFAAASALFSHFRPRGNRLAIITNGGGPGVMAADHASDINIPLAKFSPDTLEELHTVLPSSASRANPLDIIGDAGPARYAATLKACLDDGQVDGVLAILTPQAMSDPTAAARAVIKVANQSDKPLVTCWMGESQVVEARRLFRQVGIPTFRTPDPAVELFSHISNYYRNQQLLMQAPPSISDQTPPHLDEARRVIEVALAQQRNHLGEVESKALLAAFHIPIAQTMIAHSPSEAIVIAEEVGLPVVMKVDSSEVIHKSDAGGVRLNLETLTQVRDAYSAIIDEVTSRCPDASINGVAIEPMIRKLHGRELVVGITRDNIFGPTIFLGVGGEHSSNLARAVALPPLNRFLIADMLNSMQATAHLDAFRDKPPVCIEALETLLLRVSEMACELPWLTEMEINPLIVDEGGAVAVDLRVKIEELPLDAGRYDHMAIHPYPSHLCWEHQTPDGHNILIRPIRPEDAEMEQAFVKKLSSETRYYRFMNSLRELSQAQLIRLTQIDYDREQAFVAVTTVEGETIEVGVARYAMNPDGESCEFAIVVADEWKRKGLARKLMGVLIETARGRGVKYMNGEFLSENTRMLRFVRDLGFRLSMLPDDPSVKCGVLSLNPEVTKMAS